MCGIAGIIHKDGKPIEEKSLTEMRDSLIHRGPDAAGNFIHNNIGLAHRRLSIIDLSSSANQPFHSACQNYVLVFNGEIFNHQEFRYELESKGYQLRTKSDTEVLLYLLMEYGLNVLNRLIGFWSIAFLDKRKNELLLIRDRLGIKPLFYSETNQHFGFASEPKALFKYGFEKTVEETYLDELFFYRHVSGENTIFKGIKRILPGSYLIINNEGRITNKERWYHLGEASKKHSIIQQPLKWFEETFYSSIQYRMIADVPIGTLLSGGLDSSAVLYAQHQLGFKDISAWNIGFNNYKDDESEIARKFSNTLNIPFESHVFENLQLAELTKASIQFSDEPFMHMQEPFLLGICKKAKEKVSVLQSGEASDELLGGYVRYKVHEHDFRYSVLNLLRYIPEKYLKVKRWQKMKRYLQIGDREFHIMTSANNIFSSDLEKKGLDLNTLPEYRVKVMEEAKYYYPNNRLRQLLYLEQFTHLPTLNDRNDRVSMGASIENREPFEDFRLFEGVFSLKDEYFSTKGKGKYLLMKTLGNKLPESIKKHRKIGLSIPWEKHINQNDFFKNHFDKMEESELFKMGIFTQLDILELKTAYKKDDNSNKQFFQKLYFLSLWYETYFNSPL